MTILIPRPAVKRVNRVITVPKAACRPAPRLKPIIKKVATPRVATKAPVARVVGAPKPIIRSAVAQNRSVVSRQVSRAVVRRRGENVREFHDPTSTPQNVEMVNHLRGVGRGRVLVIVGNGPSVSEIDISPLAHHPKIDVMSVNKPVPSVWPSRYWLFCDSSQYNRHKDLWEAYSGVVINTKAVRAARPKGVKIKNSPGFGFCDDLHKGVHVGQSSVYVAMQVAMWMNYDVVYILGIDMTAIWKDGEMITHFFGVNPDVAPQIRAKRFDKEAKHYEHAATKLSADKRNRFVFCSSYNPYAFVDQFRRLDHKLAVDDIVSIANDK